MKSVDDNQFWLKFDVKDIGLNLVLHKDTIFCVVPKSEYESAFQLVQLLKFLNTISVRYTVQTIKRT